MLLQPNTTFDNHYTLIRQLGRGGFSEVWLAHDSYMDIDVAIKIYAPGQGMDSNSINEFRREITGVFQLNHPNLLCPKHLGIWENMPYLIMAYCPAGSCLKFVGNISESEIWHLIHDVAAGLTYLHEKDIVHQDIKPDNILMDTEGNYLITDFGISTRARSTLQKSIVGSSIAHGSGTVAYMGPERFSRQPAPTKASDIWSFGAMAFELLDGIAPFGMLGGGMQKSGAEIPFINANVSDALKFTIFKMLSKEIWDRPTAATLVEWANNPSAIEVDYDLITEEELANPKKKYDNYDSHSVLDSPVMMAHPYVISRETQRHSAAVETELNISVTPQEINVPAEGGRPVFSVRTNGGWKLQETTVPQWAKQRPTSLLHTFIMNIEANKTGKTRECSIRVLAMTRSQQAYEDVKIIQCALPRETTKEKIIKKLSQLYTIYKKQRLEDQEVGRRLRQQLLNPTSHLQTISSTKTNNNQATNRDSNLSSIVTMPRSYRGHAIVALILSIFLSFFLVFGVLAIINSSKVKLLWESKQYEAAKLASKRALIFSRIIFVFVFFMIIIGILAYNDLL